MSKIIALINQKGGVGKTATAISISQCLSQKFNKIVLVIDVDPSRNATKPFCPPNINYKFNIKNVLEDKNFDPNKAIYEANINEEIFKNLYIIPSHISLAMIHGHLLTRAHKEKILKKQLEKIKLSPDFIIIDCPPMLSEFSIGAIYAADFILIPTTYEIDALDGIGDLFDIISEIKEGQFYDYRILRNQCDKRKKGTNKFIDSELQPFIEINKVFNTIISQDELINRAKSEQQTIFTFAPDSLAANNYLNLSKEMLEIFNV